MALQSLESVELSASVRREIEELLHFLAVRQV
jgi:hypothetical protein